MMRKLAGTTLMVLPLVASCTRYEPPAPVSPRQGTAVAASFARTWDAVIDDFANRNVPIRTIERASGIIVTERRASLVDTRYADCGARRDARDEVVERLNATHTGYNILVRGDAVRSVVKVTPIYMRVDPTTGADIQVCESTGVWETEIEAMIKARAEGASATVTSSAGGDADPPVTRTSPPSPNPAPTTVPPARQTDRARDWYDSTEVDYPAQPMLATRPQFPPGIPVSKGARHIVDAEYVVDKIGRVDLATFRVVNADADPAFVAAVRDALPEWRYEPAFLRAEAVRMRVRRRFEFIDPGS
jgi:hypothetical protein